MRNPLITHTSDRTVTLAPMTDSLFDQDIEFARSFLCLSPARGDSCWSSGSDDSDGEYALVPSDRDSVSEFSDSPDCLSQLELPRQFVSDAMLSLPVADAGLATLFAPVPALAMRATATSHVVPRAHTASSAPPRATVSKVCRKRRHSEVDDADGENPPAKVITSIVRSEGRKSMMSAGELRRVTAAWTEWFPTTRSAESVRRVRWSMRSIAMCIAGSGWLTWPFVGLDLECAGESVSGERAHP